jgi:FKBP-type peptidyl-prolyl cis-trans isomerase 2
MSEVKTGDTARIQYKRTLLDGSVFDSSEGRDPLESEVGSGMIIPGLDLASPGTVVGDKKSVNVACVDAYGPINPARRQGVLRSNVPADLAIEVGMTLEMHTSEGPAMPIVVVDVSTGDVMLVANHPLAGRDLTFDIEVVGIGKA